MGKKLNEALPVGSCRSAYNHEGVEVSGRDSRRAKDYAGVEHEMPKPRGSMVETIDTGSGIIELWTQGPRAYAVVYNLQVKAGLRYDEAAKELGSCIMHALECDGRLG